MDRAGMRVVHPVGCLWWRRTAAAWHCPKLPKLPRLDPLLQKIFFQFGAERRICPREGEKKANAEEKQVF